MLLGLQEALQCRTVDTSTSVLTDRLVVSELGWMHYRTITEMAVSHEELWEDAPCEFHPAAKKKNSGHNCATAGILGSLGSLGAVQHCSHRYAPSQVDTRIAALSSRTLLGWALLSSMAPFRMQRCTPTGQLP